MSEKNGIENDFIEIAVVYRYHERVEHGALHITTEDLESGDYRTTLISKEHYNWINQTISEWEKIQDLLSEFEKVQDFLETTRRGIE